MKRCHFFLAHPVLMALLLISATERPAFASVVCSAETILAGDANTLVAAVDCLSNIANESINERLTADINLESELDISAISDSQIFRLDGAGFEVRAPSAGSTSVVTTSNGTSFLSDLTISGGDTGILSTGTASVEADRIILKENRTAAWVTSQVGDGSSIVLRHSLVFDNVVGLLGDVGTIIVNDSTVSQNTVGANIRTGSNFFFVNSSIAFNAIYGLFINAPNPLGTDDGGQIYVFSSIIGLNGTDDLEPGEDCHLNVNSARIPVYFIGETANSFDSDGSCAPFAQETPNTSAPDTGLSADLITAADISPLADNGCEPEVDCFVRMTNALTRDSIAHNSGSCQDPFFGTVSSEDARGVERGVVCDSGAHEYTGCDAQYLLPNNTWKQISLPCDPGPSNTLAAIFGDDGLGVYESDWIVWEFDPAIAYRQVALSDTLVQGRGYWIIQDNIDAQSKLLDMPTGSSTTPIDDNPLPCVVTYATKCFRINLLSHPEDNDAFNMIGNPYETETDYANIGVETSDSGACLFGCNLQIANEQEFIFDKLFVYNGSGYNELPTDQTQLEPWSGAWLARYANTSQQALSVFVLPPVFVLPGD